MARCAVSGKTDALVTSLRGPSVYATTGIRPQIRSVEVFNTTASAFDISIVRATATGTQGTALTEVCLSDDSRTVITTGFNTHTANATVGAALRTASLGAAIGAGVIWTWGPGELIIDNLTTAGLVIILANSTTAQHLNFAFEWDE